MEEAVAASLYDSGRILVCRYLPGALQPEHFDEVPMEEFYRLVAAARYARRLQQEDIERGILEAAAKLFPPEE